MMVVVVDCGRPVRSDRREKTVSLLSRGTLDLPMMRRLTDQSAIWVRIPARIAGMSKTVWRKPVTAPASMPAAMPASRATMGSQLKLTTRTAHTHPPRAKLPSTVRSAMSSSLNVTKTPRTMMPHRMPCDAAPESASTIVSSSYTHVPRPGHQPGHACCHVADATLLQY